MLALVVRTGAGRQSRPQRQARPWPARIFAITFATGVVTGIPMEFQFGTNWARFSHFAGPVAGQTLFIVAAALGIEYFQRPARAHRPLAVGVCRTAPRARERPLAVRCRQ